MPRLLKPNLFITARSFFNLNILGFSLPVCGYGVTAPTSTKLNPKANRLSIISAFLSKPAARPTGCDNLKLQKFTLSLLSTNELFTLTLHLLRYINTKSWAISGGRKLSKLVSILSIIIFKKGFLYSFRFLIEWYKGLGNTLKNHSNEERAQDFLKSPTLI